MTICDCSIRVVMFFVRLCTVCGLFSMSKCMSLYVIN